MAVIVWFPGAIAAGGHVSTRGAVQGAAAAAPADDRSFEQRELLPFCS